MDRAIISSGTYPLSLSTAISWKWSSVVIFQNLKRGPREKSFGNAGLNP